MRPPDVAGSSVVVVLVGTVELVVVVWSVVVLVVVVADATAPVRGICAGEFVAAVAPSVLSHERVVMTPKISAIAIAVETITTIRELPKKEDSLLWIYRKLNMVP